MNLSEQAAGLRVAMATGRTGIRRPLPNPGLPEHAPCREARHVYLRMKQYALRATAAKGCLSQRPSARMPFRLPAYYRGRRWTFRMWQLIGSRARAAHDHEHRA